MPQWLPTPYRGVRYHLTEFGSRNHPTNARELFNLRHSSLRVTVERAFGALENRFQILEVPLPSHIALQMASLLSAMALESWN